MSSIFCEVSKYLMIILFALYTLECFFVFRKKNTKERREAIFRRQNIWMLLLHLDGYLVLFDQTDNPTILLFYGVQVIFFLIVISTYKLLYENAAQLLVNNMCMLMAIGFLILTRLSFTKAAKQFTIAVGAMIFALGVPFMIKKIRFIRKMTWLYAVVGLLALLIVAILGATSYGAKISYTVAGISLQPSEFVKIIFVFFVAGMFHQSNSFRQVVITTVVAAAHVIVLVASKDLGGALIFFVVYITMLYVATGNPFYFIGGLLSGSVAAVIAYRLFSHVRVRVVAWQDPISVIDNEGYQICQSLFAIGTGGWFGLGLNQGSPGKIPVVEQDFVFSAIAEELGGVFAICLIMVCMSCFLMFLNIAMQLKDSFYKLVALGLGITYGFQVFLTVGGVIKFIPSTGVTLPLVSYGGSSLLSTIIIFAIIQGFYILREGEGGQNGRKLTKNPQTVKKRKATGFDTKIEDLR
ncbi:FtsW/RodA/SpoVE family cell cycle protein [Roseburia sp. BX1005]|uniref:FtsW/RodA/SpoVE family cell cycle protein n=1 Tax=Roseburia zhanii TaxID=2763064 RepID=A0A923LPQ0_9FIRM|nr:FtsW/RodA/SpoVE family cell cycle protein [Roseburia zhanii]MBC5713671.1 FtsW/RodA/SpoVE family cell cycle protein [Roseburia zhanii]